MPLHSGEIVDVTITGVHRGSSGSPGELRGSFTGDTTGELLINSQVGIFGTGGQPDTALEPVPFSWIIFCNTNFFDGNRIFLRALVIKRA